MIDLHLHSNYSDGSDSPSELIDIVLSSIRKIRAIALTDHDTIDGLKEFLSYGEEKSIVTLPGIELSIKHEPDKQIKDVHVIGLNIDPSSKKLNKNLKMQSKGRIEQKRRICERLREEFNFNITFEEVINLAGNNSIGRPHIVDVLTRNNPNKVKIYSKNDLFKMISMGGDAYVFREFEFNLREAIELIEHAGGIPILAHPGIYEIQDKKKFILMCREFGIQGLEIEYTYSKNRPYVNTEKAEWAQKFFPDYYRQIAEKYGFIKSGGSDYHGERKGIKIGDANVPDSYLKNFL